MSEPNNRALFIGGVNHGKVWDVKDFSHAVRVPIPAKSYREPMQGFIRPVNDVSASYQEYIPMTLVRGDNERAVVFVLAGYGEERAIEYLNKPLPLEGMNQ